MTAPSALVERARASADVAREIFFFGDLVRRAATNLPPRRADEAAALSLVAALLAADPTFAERHYSVSRSSWETLHFLLCRTWSQSPHTLEPTETERLWEVALTGDERLLPQPIAGWESRIAGCEVRYTEPALVTLAALALEEVSLDVLRLIHVPELLRNIDYIPQPLRGLSRDEEWAKVGQLLTALQAFYRSAAEHSDGAFVVTW